MNRKFYKVPTYRLFTRTQCTEILFTKTNGLVEQSDGNEMFSCDSPECTAGKLNWHVRKGEYNSLWSFKPKTCHGIKVFYA